MGSNKPRTRDPVNQIIISHRDEVGVARLGLMTNQVWNEDPKRLLFTLARYKFVAKMLDGRANVIEIGCGDGFCSRVVRQHVKSLTITDYDPLLIEDALKREIPRWDTKALVHDILEAPIEGIFDGAYSLDVLEHIPSDREDDYFRNIRAGLTANAVVIIGMPSLESQIHASPASKAGHINCKSGVEFRRCMETHFKTVLMFSMNDELVHTGFFPMAHYLFAIGMN